MVINNYQVDKAEVHYRQRLKERSKNVDVIKQKDLNAIKKKEGADRIKKRLSLINPRDGLALERIIGKNDLLNINYLELGLRSAQSICRIQVRNPQGQVVMHGTGFMVSPNLILTNHHVLENMEMSIRSLVDFNFEDDIVFIPKNLKTFSLDPNTFYYTDKDLDFSLIAVNPTSTDGTDLSTFGFLELIKESGKAVIGESVTIIQHPRGGTKSITLRDNLIIDIYDHFIHYQTDTMKGSSGGPIFNDQWEVVGLHHAGVKMRDDEGNVLSVEGKIWTPDMGEEKIAWKANEGIRISSIVADLQLNSDNFSADQKKLLDGILSGRADVIPSRASTISEDEAMEVIELEVSTYKGNNGYDRNFLKEPVPLPSLTADLVDDKATLKDGTDTLKYNHFSVVMSKKRRLAYFTAVNIDGSKLRKIKRSKDRWYLDPRLDKKYQSGEELYRNNPLDRGHLVRRLDPVWGAEAEEANEDTFHFANCAPQHKNLNQRTWLDLEEYILDNTDVHDLKISVFTGPIFREDDMIYRGEFKIPAEFWKVVVFLKDNKEISATAYLQTQKNLIEDLEFAFGQYRTYQVPVTRIESLTHLDFGALRNNDPLADIEGTAGRLINEAGDIVF